MRPEIPVPDTSTRDPYDVEEVADLYKARMGVWFERLNTPATVMQALMETAPGNEPERSREEIQEVREAVADCMTALDPKDVFIINAKDVERLSYSQLAERLGCSKSQGEREHKKAYTNLSTVLRSHPVIQERYPALKPTTWEEAAVTAVDRLAVIAATTIPVPFHHAIERGKQLLSAGWDNTPALNLLLQDLGASSLNSVGILRGGEIVDLLIDRHHKYGPRNILEFEEYGLLIRMSDKVARIGNKSGDFEDESVLDAYFDLIGYGAIAYMLANDLFNLPLN